MNIRKLLRDCDVAIITSPAALFYLSGFDQSDATVVLTKEQSFYLTNSLYEVAVKSAVRDDYTVKILSRMEEIGFLREVVSEADTVGVECADMTLSRFRSIFQDKDKKIFDLSPEVANMRFVKTQDELSLIKKAESIVDAAFKEVIPLLKPGITEREVKEALWQSMQRNGADATAFDTIVSFGNNAAMPHAVPSDRALRVGDCILMDFGAKYRGYCSDFTRTLHCGAPSEMFRKAYDVVLRAQCAAIEYIQKGGRSAQEADKAARDVIGGSPFCGKFTHTLGHGVGIMIHEAPALSISSKDQLTDGAVFTIEPGVYLEGDFGIRIESLCALENGKLTVIDRSDKQIIIV